MKNKYVAKCLCTTLMSAMVLTGSSTAVAASDILISEEILIEDALSDQEIPVPQPEISPAPGPETSPTPGPETSPTPGPETSPTPGPETSPTPGPETSPTPGPETSPTPGPETSPTPGPEISPMPGMTERVQKMIFRIDQLSKRMLTLEDQKELRKMREEYEHFTEEEKLAVSNYDIFVEMERFLSELIEAELSDGKQDDLTDGKDPVTKPGIVTPTPQAPQVQQGKPVYYTNMVSNLHAGKEFYLNSLKDNYRLSFSEDFSRVMDEIEKEYKAKNKLSDTSDLKNLGTTTSEDSLLVRNWQDILAIYIYEQSKKGEENHVLDASCKEELAVIFEEMNPVVRDKKNITKVSYGNYHTNHYIKKNKISRKDREILRKYMETDCKLLCAVVTGAKGFVRESVGDGVSEERVNVITSAYSLIGKVGYFWGGKSTVIGEDPGWGQAAAVTAPGSPSSGTIRAYGLDCSGFVTWSVINGYQNQGMRPVVGDGTSDQWTKARVVSEAEAQPGDFVFQRGPEAGSDNHVGILCGKTDAGDWIAVHCSSGKNGVTVGEAYGASFRYIRQPSFYPTEEELAAMEDTGISAPGTVGAVSEDTTLTSDLYESVISDDFISGNEKQDTLIDDSIVEPFAFAE